LSAISILIKDAGISSQNKDGEQKWYALSVAVSIFIPAQMEITNSNVPIVIKGSLAL